MRFTAELIILAIDLVEGILATIHINPVAFDDYVLPLTWLLLAYADRCVRWVAKTSTRKCYSCLLRCLVEALQALLYVAYCRAGSGMMVPMLVLGLVQVLVNLSTLACCQELPDAKKQRQVHELTDIFGRRGPDRHPNHGAQNKQAENSTGQLYFCRCCRCCYVDDDVKYLELATWQIIPALLNGLLPMLFQRQSPFHVQAYKICLCVMFWWCTLVCRLFRHAHSFACFIIWPNLVGHIVVSILMCNWAQSPQVTATFDQVYSAVHIVGTTLYMCAIVYVCMFQVCCGTYKAAKSRVNGFCIPLLHIGCPCLSGGHVEYMI